MKWEKIWHEGVERAKTTPLRKDVDYHIVENLHLERELGGYNIYDPVWVECVQEALMSKSPSSAFEFWRQEGWLKYAMPEIDKFWGLIQPEKYHPEIDVGIHAMMVIDRSSFHNLSIESRLACLFHDIGKSLTEPGVENHFQHEKNGVPFMKKYIKEWNLNKSKEDIILTVGLYHGEVHNFNKRLEKSALELIEDMGFLNNGNDRNIKVLSSIVCDDQGRKNFFNSEPRGVYLISKSITAIKKLNEKLEVVAQEKFKERDQKGISYGAAPIVGEKKQRVLADIKRKLLIGEMSTILKVEPNFEQVEKEKFKMRKTL